MATAHVRADTPVPPGRIRAALTDFTDRRPDYWPNLDRNRYQVHATGDTCKLVTLAEVDAIVTVVRRLLPGLTDRDSGRPHRGRGRDVGRVMADGDTPGLRLPRFTGAPLGSPTRSSTSNRASPGCCRPR